MFEINRDERTTNLKESIQTCSEIFVNLKSCYLFVQTLDVEARFRPDLFFWAWHFANVSTIGPNPIAFHSNIYSTFFWLFHKLNHSWKIKAILKVILKEYCFAAKVDWATSFCDCESVLLFSISLSLLFSLYLSLFLSLFLFSLSFFSLSLSFLSLFLFSLSFFSLSPFSLSFLSPASILFLFFDQKIQSSKACNGKERQPNWSVN